MVSIVVTELTAEEIANEDATLTKKRSIFRSPGTASSPDLATLVKKAKDKGKMPASSSQASVRERSVSSAKPQDEVRSIASGSTDRMGTISETSSRRRQNSDDGFKVGLGQSSRKPADGRACEIKLEGCWVECLG